MPKYRVTKPYNHEVKVGDYITTDNLHPSLLAHVVLADDSSLEVATPGESDRDARRRQKALADADQQAQLNGEPPMTAAQLKKQEAQLKKQEAEKAKQIEKSEAPVGEKPTDPAPTIVPDEDGPGENS